MLPGEPGIDRTRARRLSPIVKVLTAFTSVALLLGLIAAGRIDRPSGAPASAFHTSAAAEALNTLFLPVILRQYLDPIFTRSIADDTGTQRTVSASGSIDAGSRFFSNLGTNGRTCESCHQAQAAWSITPKQIQTLFNNTNGLDPLFRTNDGSNSPKADVSTLEARRSAYNMLLTKGLIRVGMPLPPDADFSLDSVDDPYGFAGPDQLSLFRRPLPATNLRFLSDVMWDGRESVPGGTRQTELSNQARNATLGHAEATGSPTASQIKEIVDFELGLHAAQDTDAIAGPLDALGATGGPVALATQPFSRGNNDPFPTSPGGPTFTPNAFTIFRAWELLTGTAVDPADARRRSIARGEVLFNTRAFSISGVAGLNDVVGQTRITGTCSTCHNAPNVGSDSASRFINIGGSDASQRTPDLPLYTFHCFDPEKIVKTTDPGRALITGKCADMGKIKTPSMRGLAARAPYFHDGAFATLTEVLNFYTQRFGIFFLPQEKADLIAFMQSL